MADVNVSHICNECGNDKPQIDSEKSNENWTVYLTKCPKCGGYMRMRFY